MEGKVKPHCLAKHIGQIKQKDKARRMEMTGLNKTYIPACFALEKIH